MTGRYHVSRHTRRESFVTPTFSRTRCLPSMEEAALVLAIAALDEVSELAADYEDITATGTPSDEVTITASYVCAMDYPGSYHYKGETVTETIAYRISACDC